MIFMRIIRKKQNITALYVAVFIAYILSFAALYNLAQIQNIKSEIARSKAQIEEYKLGTDFTIHSTQSSGQVWTGIYEPLGMSSEKSDK